MLFERSFIPRLGYLQNPSLPSPHNTPPSFCVSGLAPSVARPSLLPPPAAQREWLLPSASPSSSAAFGLRDLPSTSASDRARIAGSASELRSVLRTCFVYVPTYVHMVWEAHIVRAGAGRAFLFYFSSVGRLGALAAARRGGLQKRGSGTCSCVRSGRRCANKGYVHFHWRDWAQDGAGDATLSDGKRTLIMFGSTFVRHRGDGRDKRTKKSECLKRTKTKNEKGANGWTKYLLEYPN
ncbi:hypothetical protein BDY21DRAFT_344269 [Lineolata rhizophorae]|uniref:Uncharacterized protein n=1 Tax=Lineolata rhizophorae TaxID=578093 RepID=A0A6A6P0S1_9PEZI|nr:hypothetical protein BDY21DRAFT_344269 [Lineolata rhizophorae]